MPHPAPKQSKQRDYTASFQPIRGRPISPHNRRGGVPGGTNRKRGGSCASDGETRAEGTTYLGAAEFDELYQRVRRRPSGERPSRRGGQLNYITSAIVLATAGEIRCMAP